jgi:hypothetical protein
MTSAQRRVIAAAELDASDFYRTSEGWSHNGFVAWQLELCDESKRTATDDSRIAEVLRRLDDLE